MGSSPRWRTQAEYEAAHGTQEAQAKAQVVASDLSCDGPWKLQREIGRDSWGHPRYAILPNSIRSTSREAERLIAEERARTGMEWEMTRL